MKTYRLPALALSCFLLGLPSLTWAATDEHATHDHAHEDHDGDHESPDGHEDHDEAEHRDGHDDHEGDGDHEGHDEHGDHEGHGHEEEGGAIRLDPDALREFGIETAIAGPGSLGDEIVLPGEIVPNADRLAHVLPRVRGIVREVKVGLGDRVEAGQVLAVLDSRDLADAKAAHLAAVERLSLAEANFTREERLFERKVSAERDYLEARQALAEARIEARSTEQQLHAIGLSEADLARLGDEADTRFTRFEIRAPFTGTIIQKHISLGELLTDEDEAFVIADLSEVWVHLSVYPSDLARTRVGQRVRVSTSEGLEADGLLTYVAPIVSEATRTALARAALENTDGAWRPGLFVTGRVVAGEIESRIVVPRSAVIPLDEGPVVFVQDEDGFEPREITLGRSDDHQVEVVRGLIAGERFAARNAFVLKSEMEKDALAHAGHAH